MPVPFSHCLSCLPAVVATAQLRPTQHRRLRNPNKARRLMRPHWQVEPATTLPALSGCPPWWRGSLSGWAPTKPYALARVNTGLKKRCQVKRSAPMSFLDATRFTVCSRPAKSARRLHCVPHLLPLHPRHPRHQRHQRHQRHPRAQHSGIKWRWNGSSSLFPCSSWCATALTTLG